MDRSQATPSEAAGARVSRGSALTVGLVVDHVKALRIPLLIIVFGVILTFWVDQVWELFLLLVLPNSGVAASVGTAARAGALVMAGCLGFAVWHTARTVYRFDIPTLPTLSDPNAEGLREWLPRVLGAAIPLLMAVGTAIALQNPSVKATGSGSPWVPILFGVEALVLFVFFIARRQLFGGLSSLAKHPSGDPRVSRWSQLPPSVRAVYAVIMIANFLALILAAKEPGLLSKTGALGVVLLCATFLTVTGTYLTVQAARWQFPLLTALFVLACALQFLGCNDNHRVRLYAGMHSFDTPSAAAVDPGAPIASSFLSYAASWNQGRQPAEPVYLVSSEGGGIRAAAWTLLVLSRLEVASNGEFSKHMLLGSGVSGGSLGLAWFAALVYGERQGVIHLQDIDTLTRQLSTADYLGPTVETMFLTDFLQRFWVRPAFVDRGERLESRFEVAWSEACRHRPSAASATAAAGSSLAASTSPATASAATSPTAATATLPSAAPSSLAKAAEQAVCSQFARPWKDLWAGTQHVPLLFLNSTDVQTGQRFVEEPFQSLRAPTQDMDVANFAVFSYGLLPASSPLSAVVHNSARFTYVSPAGSLTDAALLKQGKSLTRQLVDGGYFENSGTTTLGELLVLLHSTYAAACGGETPYGGKDCPVRLIHISNDPGVESMRSDDSCPDANRYDVPYSKYGEIRAPLIALVNTRDARGVAARVAVRHLFTQGLIQKDSRDPFTDASVFHFRLCNGQYRLPLGWALSDEAFAEMQRQLEGLPPTDPAGFNHRQLDTISAAVAAR